MQSRPEQHAICSAPAGTRPCSALDIAGATVANDGAVDSNYSQKTRQSEEGEDHKLATSRVIPVSSKMRFGTGGRVGLEFNTSAKREGRGLTNVCKATCREDSWLLSRFPSVSRWEVLFPNITAATSMTLHHLNDSPVVSTSTTAHSMSPKDVASLTARVVTCLEGIIVACCCCGADEVAVRCRSRMYVLKELKLVLCELFA